MYNMYVPITRVNRNLTLDQYFLFVYVFNCTVASEISVTAAPVSTWKVYVFPSIHRSMVNGLDDAVSP